MEILELITAGGFGAIIVTIIQSFLADRTIRKQRLYEEKKEAYAGFLDAMHRSEIEQTHDAALWLGHQSNICEIVGSKLVRDCLERVLKSNPIDGKLHPNRPQAIAGLKEAMRKDLGFPLD